MTTGRTTGVLLFCTLLAAPAAAAEADRVGSETCAVCHGDTAEPFGSTVHGKADPEGACEGCHGPGGRHVEEGSAEAIGRFGPARPASERTAACLSCHGRGSQGRTWASADHALAGVACDDCHDPHGAGRHPALLRTKDRDLCLECHGTIRAQFDLPSRHPLASGSGGCVDCHNPHAATDRRRLGGFKQNDCLRCHTEYRGPWVFEHEVVAVEGCTACHTPHGSVNRHLLAYPRVSDLCLQCHPEQPFFHVAVDGGGRRTTGINDCTRCHAEIHGSNNDALFLN